jgi:hypothetical protein
MRPDGRELEWDEHDVAEIDPDRGSTGANSSPPATAEG